MAKRLGKTKKLWLMWGLMYCVCAVCSFIPASQGQSHGVLLMLLGFAFFIPPALLIRYSVQKKRQKPLEWVRNLSVLALILTVVMIILNFLAASSDSEALGQVVHWILVFTTVPMVCAQIWLIGIFGWACLLMTTLHYLYFSKTQKKRKQRHSH